MESSIIYYAITIIFLLNYICIFYLKNPFILIWIVFGLLPVLDEYVSHDLTNPSKEEQRKMKSSVKYKIPLYTALILDWLSLYWGIRAVMESSGYLYNIGVIFSTMTIQASSFNLAHELGHKNNLFEKIISIVHLSKNHYMHFFIEHNYGHHRNVATWEDPATARYNEAIYSFYWRSITRSYLSAWRIENKLCLENYGQALNWRNKMIYFTMSLFMIPLSLLFFFGLKVMLLQLLIGYSSILFFESINYIEHYGLMRKKLEDGKYENVNITHSWNAPHRISNYILFKLQRHSDHHENSLKPYQNLCTYDKSPILPNGYSFCVLLCLFPRIWFSIMNPLVDHYKKGENISEKVKEIIDKNTLMFLFYLNLVTLSFSLLQIIL